MMAHIRFRSASRSRMCAIRAIRAHSTTPAARPADPRARQARDHHHRQGAPDFRWLRFVTVTLNDGRVLTRSVADFKGTPEHPARPSRNCGRNSCCWTRHCTADDMGAMLDRLQNLENESILIGSASARFSRSSSLPRLTRQSISLRKKMDARVKARHDTASDVTRLFSRPPPSNEHGKLHMAEQCRRRNVHTADRAIRLVAHLRGNPRGGTRAIKLLILDSLGCAIYGADSNGPASCRHRSKPWMRTRTTSVWGTRMRLSSPHAALVNGTQYRASSSTMSTARACLLSARSRCRR